MSEKSKAQMFWEAIKNDNWSIVKAAEAFGFTIEEANQLYDNIARNAEKNAGKTQLEIVVDHYNERFFVVGNMGGKCRILWHENDPALPGRKVLGVQTFADFRNRYDNIEIQVGTKGNGDPINKGQGSAWIDHYARRQFDTITFAPGQELGRNVYNLWKGFAVEPREGDCSLYLAHVRDNLCTADAQLYEWVISWLAYAVQKPGEPGHTAIVLQGGKGTGKNTFADIFGRLWGVHYFAINNPVHLAGRFNSHLRECCVLFGNEAFYAGNHEHENVLKGLITDEWLPVEQKFQDLITVKNVLHVILASNSDWIVRTTQDERRFCVLNVSDEHQQDKPYFAAIHRQMEAGGYEALLHMLLHRDLSQFDPRSAPRTRGLSKQTARSLQGIDAAWYECLQLGLIPGSYDTKGTLYLRAEDLVEWAGKYNPRWKSISAIDVGNLLGKRNRWQGDKQPMGFKHGKPYLFDGQTTRRGNAYAIPSLSECRKLWSQLRDGDWGEGWDLKGDDDWEITKDMRRLEVVER